MFVKALIFHYFNLKCYIQIEINIVNYVIDTVFGQLNIELVQWHLVMFFLSQNMIYARTYHYTYANKFLAIIETFKT